MLMLLFHLAVQLQHILNNTRHRSDLCLKYSAQKLGGGGGREGVSSEEDEKETIGALPIKSKHQFKKPNPHNIK